MTRFLAKTTAVTLGGLAIAAALSLTAFGSAGRRADEQPEPSGRDARKAHASPLHAAKVGEACGPATGGCDDPAFCDESLHCVIGDAGLGQVCGRHAECRAPFICPWGRHVCSTPAKIGQSCHTNPGGRSECEAGSGCNGTRCVAQESDGHSCLADEECKAGICTKGGCGHGVQPSFAARGTSTGD